MQFSNIVAVLWDDFPLVHIFSIGCKDKETPIFSPYAHLHSLFWAYSNPCAGTHIHLFIRRLCQYPNFPNFFAFIMQIFVMHIPWGILCSRYAVIIWKVHARLVNATFIWNTKTRKPIPPLLIFSSHPPARLHPFIFTCAWCSKVWCIKNGDLRSLGFYFPAPCLA